MVPRLARDHEPKCSEAPDPNPPTETGISSEPTGAATSGLQSDRDAPNRKNPTMGRVERATRKSLTALRKDKRLTEDAEGLAAVAVVLAQEIDQNGGDAAVARELRLILDSIRKRDKQDDDDFDAWTGELSSPVGNEEGSKP